MPATQSCLADGAGGLIMVAVVVRLFRFRSTEPRPDFLFSTWGKGRIKSFQGVQMTLMSQRDKKQSLNKEQAE